MQLFKCFFLFVSLCLVFSSCQKDEIKSKENKVQTSVRSNNNAPNYPFALVRTQQEQAFVDQVEQIVTSNGGFDFTQSPDSDRGIPNWNMAFGQYRDNGTDLMIVPIIQGTDVNAFFQIQLSDQIKFFYHDKIFLEPPFNEEYYGNGMPAIVEIYHLLQSNIDAIPPIDYTTDTNIIIDFDWNDVEAIDLCFFTQTVEFACTGWGHSYAQSSSCKCNGSNGCNPPSQQTWVNVMPCNDGGAGGQGGFTDGGGYTSGGGGNNTGGNGNNDSAQLAKAKSQLNELCEVISPDACTRFFDILDQCQDPSCLHFPQEMLQFINDNDYVNEVDIVSCLMEKMTVVDNPSAANFCESAIDQSNEDFANLYNMVSSTSLNWQSNFVGLEDLSCDLLSDNYDPSEVDRFLNLFASFFGDYPEGVLDQETLDMWYLKSVRITYLKRIITNSNLSVEDVEKILNLNPSIIEDIPDSQGWQTYVMFDQFIDDNPGFNVPQDVENYLQNRNGIMTFLEMLSYSKTPEGKTDAGIKSMEIYSQLAKNDLLNLTDEQANSEEYGPILDLIIGSALSLEQKELSIGAWYNLIGRNFDYHDGNFMKGLTEALTDGWEDVFKPIKEDLKNYLEESGVPSTKEEWKALMTVYGPMLVELGIDVGTDFIPVVGEAKGIYKAKEAFSEGKYGEAALEIVGVIAGVVPIGDLLKGAAGVVTSTVIVMKAFKVMKALAKVSGNIFNKIIELGGQGYEILWDDGLKKLIFKNADEVPVGHVDEFGVPHISDDAFKWVTDLDGFKDLTAKGLTSGQSNSISKTFINENGVKFNLTDDHHLKSKFDEIVELGDNSNPPGAGKRTEELMEDLFHNEQGYSKLDGSYNSGINGFDGVFQKGDEIIISESKQWTGANSVSLSGPGANVPAQMTDEWVDFVADKLEIDGNAALANIIRDAKDTGKLTKVVTVVDRTTGGNANGLLGGIAIVKVN